MRDCINRKNRNPNIRVFLFACDDRLTNAWLIQALSKASGLALGQTGPCPEPLGSTKESIVRWNPSRCVKSVAAGT